MLLCKQLSRAKNVTMEYIVNFKLGIEITLTYQLVMFYALFTDR